MNVQPKLQTRDPTPKPVFARPTMRRSPEAARSYGTRIAKEETWPLELDVEPWHP